MLFKNLSVCVYPLSEIRSLQNPSSLLCLRANCNAYSLARYCPHSLRTITLLRRRPYPNRDKTLAYCLHPSPILMYLSVQLYISFILKKQFFYLLMIFSILTVCCHPFPSFKSIYSSIFVKSSFTSHFKDVILCLRVLPFLDLPRS